MLPGLGVLSCPLYAAEQRGVAGGSAGLYRLLGDVHGTGGVGYSG